MSNAKNNNRFFAFALIFISSPDGETSTAALFCLNLYFFAGRRNINRCFVFTRIFISSPDGETSTAALSLPESLFLRRTTK
jgi:hypothetical protein